MALLNFLLVCGVSSARAQQNPESSILAPQYVAYGAPPQLYYQQPTYQPAVPQLVSAKSVETSPQYPQFAPTQIQDFVPPRSAVNVPKQAELANQYIPDFFMAAGVPPPSKPAARQIDGDYTNLAKVVPLGPAATATGVSTVPYHLRTMPTPNNDELIPGEVFKLVTLSDDPEFDNETVVIYRDGTLGIAEPQGPGYMFQGLLLSEYGLLFAPEPLRTVKFNDKKVFFLNESLYNPAPVFVADKWSLLINGAQAAICPSWNSVLVTISDSEPAPCDDWVNVKLHIVPLSI